MNGWPCKTGCWGRVLLPGVSDPRGPGSPKELRIEWRKDTNWPKANRILDYRSLDFCLLARNARPLCYSVRDSKRSGSQRSERFGSGTTDPRFRKGGEFLVGYRRVAMIHDEGRLALLCSKDTMTNLGGMDTLQTAVTVGDRFHGARQARHPNTKEGLLEPASKISTAKSLSRHTRTSYVDMLQRSPPTPRHRYQRQTHNEPVPKRRVRPSMLLL